MNINIKSLYNLTRQARAIKDRGKLSLSGQSEVRKLVKCELLDLEPDVLTGNKLPVEKSRFCREEALKMLNEYYDLELVGGLPNLEYKNLYGTVHAMDLVKKTLHLISIPYNISNLELSADDYKSSNGYDERLFTAYGLLYLSKKLNFGIEKCQIHYVYVDTPNHLMGFDLPELHQFGDKLPIDKRICTIDVSLDEETEKLIEDSLNQTEEFIEEYKNKIK